MTEPIVFISHFKIKEGALDAYRQMQHEAVRALEADKPRTLAMLPYLDADGTRLTIVHLFADAESMDLHFVGAAERSAAAYEVLVPDGWEIYGTPSDQALDTMRNAAVASGVSLTLQPDYVGGFLRQASA
jgi:hypothetical protein